MDWDDEKYDETSEEFYENIYDVQQSLFATCIELITTDGEPIEDYKV